jgi:hypothetical protein
MPLFFLIAIGAGALTVGAVTVDATSDIRAHRESSARVQAVQETSFQASAYATPEDCLNAAALQGAPLSVCKQS